MAVVGALAKEICQSHSSMFAALIPVVPSEIGSLAHGSRTSLIVVGKITSTRFPLTSIKSFSVVPTKEMSLASAAAEEV